jgi:hypothetical protein
LADAQLVLAEISISCTMQHTPQEQPYLLGLQQRLIDGFKEEIMAEAAGKSSTLSRT